MQKKSILFVCVGNTCRSPIAEFIAKTISNDEISIYSCGINVISENVNLNTKIVLEKKLNINLENFKPKSISDINLNSIDKIYSLDKKVTEYLEKIIEGKKIITIDIVDPYNQKIVKYENTFIEIALELLKIKSTFGEL